MKRVLIVVSLIVAAIVLGLAGLLALWRQNSSPFLSKAPEHGMVLVIDVQLAEPEGKADLGALKEALGQRLSRRVGPIYWEQISPARIRIMTRPVSPEELDKIKRVSCRSGLLEFRLVHEQSQELVQSNEIPPGYELLKSRQRRPDGGTVTEQLVVKKRPEPGLGIGSIKQAMVTKDNLGQPQISFMMHPRAAAAFAQITRDNVGRRLAIMMDGELYSAPVIRSPIEAGNGLVTGQFTLAEAFDLANIMEYSLPIPITVVESKSF